MFPILIIFLFLCYTPYVDRLLLDWRVARVGIGIKFARQCLANSMIAEYQVYEIELKK